MQVYFENRWNRSRQITCRIVMVLNTRRNVRSSLKCPSDPTNKYIFIYLQGCFASFSPLLISACVVHKNEQRKERTAEKNKKRERGWRNDTPF